MSIAACRIEFSSIYNVRDLQSKSWDGNSAVAAPVDAQPHDYRLHYPNGTTTLIPAGNYINIPLKEVIALAGKQSTGLDNFNLDMTNNFVRQDVLGSGQFPTYRMTGLDIQVTLVICHAPRLYRACTTMRLPAARWRAQLPPCQQRMHRRPNIVHGG